MKIYKKLAEAREIIKAMKVKKAGRNTFSSYDYFTPEQVSAMVHEAEKQAGIIHLFSMTRTENGLHGHLFLKDVETGEEISLMQATEIPEIKATNAAQQVGGAVTYTLRYMLMTAFDIADNSLDPDAHDNRPKEVKQPVKQKPVMSAASYDIMKGMLTPENARQMIADTRKKYILTDEQEKFVKEWEDNF